MVLAWPLWAPQQPTPGPSSCPLVRRPSSGAAAADHAERPQLLCDWDSASLMGLMATPPPDEVPSWFDLRSMGALHRSMVSTAGSVRCC